MGDDTKFTLELTGKANTEALSSAIDQWKSKMNGFVDDFRKISNVTVKEILDLGNNIASISKGTKITTSPSGIIFKGTPTAPAFTEAEKAANIERIKVGSKPLEPSSVSPIGQGIKFTSKIPISPEILESSAYKKRVAEATEYFKQAERAQKRERQGQEETARFLSKEISTRNKADLDRVRNMQQQVNLAKSNLLILEREPELKNKVSGILQKIGVQTKDISQLTTKQGQALKDQLQILSAQERARERWQAQLHSLGFGLIRIGGQLKQIGMIGLAAMGGMIRDSVMFNLELIKMSKGLNVPLQDIGRLAYIADATGVPVEELTKGIGNYFQSLLRAGQGTSMIAARVREALDMVGISSLKLGEETGMSTVQMLGKMRNAFQAMKNPQDKAYIGQMIFGQAYEQFLPLLTMGNEQWSKMLDTFDKLFPNFAQNAESMQKSIYNINAIFAIWRMTIRTLGGELLDTALPMLEKFTGGVRNLISWLNNLDPFLKGVVANLVLWGPVVALVSGYLISFAGNIITLIGWFGKINAFLLTNPWVLYTAAIATTVVAITSLIGKVDDTNRAFQRQLENGYALRNQFNGLFKTYSELRSKTSLTSEEQKKLSVVTEELTSRFPEFIKTVDLSSASLNTASIAAGKFANNLMLIAQITAYKGWLEDARKAEVNLQLAVEERRKDFEKAQKEYKVFGKIGELDPVASTKVLIAENRLKKTQANLNKLQSNIKDVESRILSLGTGLLPERVTKSVQVIPQSLLDFEESINKVLSKGIIQDKTISEYESQIQRLEERTTDITDKVKTELAKHENDKVWQDWGKNFFDSILPKKVAEEKLKIVRNTFQGIENELQKFGKEKLRKHFELFIDVGAFTEAEEILREIIEMSAQETKDALDKRYDFLDEEFRQKEPALYKEYLFLRREEENAALETQKKDLEIGLNRITDARLKIRENELKKEAKLLSDNGDLKGAYQKELALIDVRSAADIEKINRVSDIEKEAKDNRIKDIKEVADTEKESKTLEYTQKLWNEKKSTYQDELKFVQKVARDKFISSEAELSAYKIIYASLEKQIDTVKKEGKVSTEVTKDMTDELRNFGESINNL